MIQNINDYSKMKSLGLKHHALLLTSHLAGNHLVGKAHRLTPHGNTRALGLHALINAHVPPVLRKPQPPASGRAALTLLFVEITGQVIFTVSRRVTHVALPTFQPFDVTSALDASDDDLASELVRHTGLEVRAQLAMAKGTDLGRVHCAAPQRLNKIDRASPRALLEQSIACIVVDEHLRVNKTVEEDVSPWQLGPGTGRVGEPSPFRVGRDPPHGEVV
mmetsp:Transcript_21119/g.46916  ORF Transcript_21119/g.46916 Transcript_21119/m.46916 type:complete len:219 (-) Transcript_21119:196-852(-)